MAVYLLKMLEVHFDFKLIWRVRRIESSWYLVYMLLLGNKTVISWLFGEKSKPLPLGASDDPMDYCSRPRAVVHHGHPRHLGAIVLTIHQTSMK